jgi:DNA-directed RNA polymerase II subunit RPB1
MSFNAPTTIHEISAITGVQFGIYSPEELLKRSVAHITESTLYDSSGEPKIGGLFDPRMGYIEPYKKCKTCQQTHIKCPGHFGHIELVKPVFNMQYDAEIVKILKCFCIKCSRILVNINHPQIKHIIATTKGNNMERFEKVFKFITSKVMTGKARVCGAAENKGDGGLLDNGGCGAIQPTKYTNNIRNPQFTCVTADWKYTNETGVDQEISQKLNAEIILAIFKRISEEHALVIGQSPKWCMPSWLVITVLPVVPPCVRPSVRQYNNQRSEDDLTHCYNDIVKFNNILKNEIAKVDSNHIQDYNDIVQKFVSNLFNNDIKGIPQALTRSMRPLKTFAERLGGKEGRIRSNLMGKRVDYSARSVISPDPNLLISELGIPKKIAMNLTFPVVVNKYNMSKMYELVRNGNDVYPGAKSVKSAKDGKIHFVQYKRDVILNPGDIVNRHLINGDIVLFNRQPSLHKMSMMALEVRVIEGSTFRINPDICEPFNADFD